MGGVAGIGICVWTYTKIIQQTGFKVSAATALFGAFICIFGWSTWVGVNLWRGKPQAQKWAAIVLALQIPNISIPGFAYQFYTGMTLYLSWNFIEAKLDLEFQLASSIALQVSSKIEDSILGLNLIAVAALMWLLYGSRIAPKSRNASVGGPQT